MNATEARKRRAGSTLTERLRRDPLRAARIDRLVAEAAVEQALQQIMEIENVSAAELARRVNSKPPQISRDFHGGLRKARVSRLVTLAHALGYGFVPAFIPKGDSKERKAFFESYLDVLPKPKAHLS
jgi:hypothetical protein